MEFSESLPLSQDLLNKMESTEQNPRYHGEGNVLAHTEYVLKKLLAMDSFQELSRDDQEVLYWTAVLHDVGKAFTTRFEEGRWRSPGHERESVQQARAILREQELAPERRNQVLELILAHGKPLQWSRAGINEDELKLLATRLDIRLLSIFGRADLEGRDCEGKQDLVDAMRHILKKYVPKAEYELASYGKLQETFAGWPVAKKNAAFKAVSLGQPELLERLVHEPDRFEVPTHPPRTRVSLTLGFPGVGKSDWISQELPDAFLLQLADFGLDEETLRQEEDFYLSRRLVELGQMMQIYLRRHPDLVIEGRLTIPALREGLNQMLRGLEQKPEIHYIVFDRVPDGGDFGGHELMPIHPWEAHRVHYPD